MHLSDTGSPNCPTRMFQDGVDLAHGQIYTLEYWSQNPIVLEACVGNKVSCIYSQIVMFRRAGPWPRACSVWVIRGWACGRKSLCCTNATSYGTLQNPQPPSQQSQTNMSANESYGFGHTLLLTTATIANTN